MNGFDISGGNGVVTEAFVPSFNDYVDTCSNFNYWGHTKNCTAVTFLLDGASPGNCWGKNGDVLVASD